MIYLLIMIKMDDERFAYILMITIDILLVILIILDIINNNT